MEAAFLSLIIAFSIGLTIYGLGARFSGLRQLYYSGIVAWSQWLPVIAAIAFITVIGSNVMGAHGALAVLSIRKMMTYPELLVLLVVSPLFFTRAGGVLAAGSLLYLLQRLNFGVSSVVTLPWLICIGALTVVAVMADRMPWNNTYRTGTAAGFAREFVLMLMSFGVIASVMVVLMKTSVFIHWTDLHYSTSLSTAAASSICGAVLIGWFLVTIGYARHFALPILCLPSLFIMAFVTKWPPYILVIPFAATLALSVAYIDRRRKLRN